MHQTGQKFYRFPTGVNKIWFFSILRHPVELIDYLMNGQRLVRLKQSCYNRSYSDIDIFGGSVIYHKTSLDRWTSVYYSTIQFIVLTGALPALLINCGERR